MDEETLQLIIQRVFEYTKNEANSKKETSEEPLTLITPDMLECSEISDSAKKAKKEIDKKTLKLVTQCALKNRENVESKVNAEEDVKEYAEALSEIFGVGVDDVFMISFQVLNSQKEREKVNAPSLTKIWKYLLIGGLILLLALFLLWGKVQKVESGNQFLAQSLALSSEEVNDRSYLHHGIFERILKSMSPVKRSVEEFFKNRWEYPTYFVEMKLNKEKLKSKRYMRDIWLKKQGKIVIKATERLGDDIYIILTPIANMEGSTIRWQCETNYQQSTLRVCEQSDSVLIY